MRIRPAALLLAMASLFALTGCFGKVKYPTYYTLQLAPPLTTHAAEPATASIAVREFRAPEYLRRGAIVYRPSSEEVGFYEYSRWATEPPTTVTDAVVAYLRDSGNFTQVKNYDGRSDVDYVLTGRLERLDEVDYQGGVKVEVALSAQITDSRTGKTIWQNSASDEAIVDKREVSDVVSTMSHAMDHAIVTLLSSLPVSAGTKSGL